MIFCQRNEVKLTEIPVLYIMPNKLQPRKNFDRNELEGLAKSISKNGVLQPITVRKISSVEYELITGERRLRASIMAGLNKIPCNVMNCSDGQSAIYSLVENIQRTNLNMFEEAQAIKRLILEYRMTQQQVARYLGKNQSDISNKIELLKLSENDQNIIIKNNLTEYHATAILKLNEYDRNDALNEVVEKSLNVEQTEKLVKEILNGNDIKQHKNKPKKIIIKDVRIFMNTFTKAFDTMKLSGIDAVSNKVENDEYIEYSVKIPKSSAYSR